MRAYVSLILLGLLVFSCTSNQKPWEQKIDQITQDLSVNHINLDEIEQKEIAPDSLLTFGTSQKFTVAKPISIVPLNDSLYVLDQKQNGIFVIDPDGHTQRFIDEEEYLYLITLVNQLFVLGPKKGQYELVGSYKLVHPDGKGKYQNFTLYNDKLYLNYNNYPNDILMYNLSNFR